MAEQVKSIEEILAELNQESSDWEEEKSLFALDVARVNGEAVSVNRNSGAILKLFVNKKTGEVKTYLAKKLDTDARDLK